MTGSVQSEATIEEMAATDFTAWTDVDLSKPSNEQMKSLQKAMRISMGVMGKTKSELVAATRDVGSDTAMGAIDEINEAAQTVSAFLGILEGASARMFIALSAVVLETEEGGEA